MNTTERPVLVVGATGFLGRRIVAALQEDRHPVRALARTPQRAQDLASSEVGVVEGDMLDAASIDRAVDGAAAVIVCVHTISKQTGGASGAGFMDLEHAGIQNIIAAAIAHGVQRVIYVTSIGVAEDAVNTWLKGRWATEQLLLESGLDATIIRPGMIVGHGGDGFGMVERGARSSSVFLLARREQRFRTVGVDDLARQIVFVLDDPRAFGNAYEVGSDDVLTTDEMIDIAAEYLGRPPPRKVHLPRAALARLAPLVERVAGMPRGAIGGFVGPGSGGDMIGDAAPIRALLKHPPQPYRESMIAALAQAEPPA